MIDFVVQLVINAIALLVAVELVPGLSFDFGQDWWKLVLVALIFGVINTYLKPILKTLSLPISLFTMGLVGFVINTALFLLLALASSQLTLGFLIHGWPKSAFTSDVVVAAFLGSIVVSVVSTVLGLAFGQKRVLGLRI
ncbi:MAG TPA: phage holin family protein [Candidatus Limnocylindrales bacterium]|jgi:putative membrane protein|nr:phage holin family protein [Candidatus Limnocylindrales bacterium]